MPTLPFTTFPCLSHSYSLTCFNKSSVFHNLQGLRVFSGTWIYNKCLGMKVIPRKHNRGTFKTEYITSWHMTSWRMTFQVKTKFLHYFRHARGDKCHPGICPPGHFSTRAFVLPGHISTRAYGPRATLDPGKRHRSNVWASFVLAITYDLWFSCSLHGHCFGHI